MFGFSTSKLLEDVDVSLKPMPAPMLEDQRFSVRVYFLIGIVPIQGTRHSPLTSLLSAALHALIMECIQGHLEEAERSGLLTQHVSQEGISHDLIRSTSWHQCSSIRHISKIQHK
jgi:hypothetical protein